MSKFWECFVDCAQERLLSHTSQILWLWQHFCPPPLTILACISIFSHQLSYIHIGMVSSGKRVVVIHNSILFDVNRDVDLKHFFCNHIGVVSCAMWWTFHIKTTSYSVLFWFWVPENGVNLNFTQCFKLIVLFLIIKLILNRKILLEISFLLLFFNICWSWYFVRKTYFFVLNLYQFSLFILRWPS